MAPMTIHEVWHGDRIDMRTAGRRGVLSAAKRLLAVSLPLVPVDTAFLRSTGRAKLVVRGGDDAAAEVSYDTDYAVFVHEILSNQHDDGQAKFLEAPLHSFSNELFGLIAKEVRDAIQHSL